MTHYETGGRGRKQCAGCKKFYASVGKVCPNCGATETVRREIVQKTVKVHDSPGPGRKHCPDCEKFVAARTRVCFCGHQFEKKADSEPKPSPPPKPEKSAPEYSGNDMSFNNEGRPLLRITTPAGKCPVALSGTSEEEVLAWKDEVVLVGQQQRAIHVVELPCEIN